MHQSEHESDPNAAQNTAKPAYTKPVVEVQPLASVVRFGLGSADDGFEGRRSG
jgi:hypothetical protein